MMRYGSLFSGVGGFDLGLDRAGMSCAWQVEKDDYARGVLDYRWPGVPKFDDVTTFGKEQASGPVDLICGGFPCQDLSVAGRRAGLAGERSGLFHEFMRLAAEFSPRWLLIENVPGLLSSDGGRDMAIVTSTLAGLGYGWAYRILDSQYFGLAQRRRRVFIVCCLGEPARAAKVLFESDCLPGHSQPGRAPGADNPGGVAACLNSGGNNGGFRTEPGEHIVAGALSAHATRHGHAMTTQQAAEAGHLIAYPDPAYTLAGSRTGSGRDAQDTFIVALGSFLANQGVNAGGIGWDENLSPTLNSAEGGNRTPAIAFTERGRDGGRQLEWQAAGVRRLTQRECERLQGFPDDWTLYRIQNGERVEQSDSARYRQLGNAVSVPVAEWIARRIVEASHENT